MFDYRLDRLAMDKPSNLLGQFITNKAIKFFFEYYMIMIIDQLLIDIHFYDNFSTPLSIKVLVLLFLLDSVYPNPRFFAWCFNYFLNNFHIN